ncbi:acylphosphatase [Ornithinibacillus sp. JPR2-1]|uniref:acylphosphatase n=1 Tax=Ornithinibacillus sp. JPR2-1 TaxID=2094019 RepID=UPI0031D76347
MSQNKVELFPHLTHEVVSDITGFKLCSYLVALEGWRRGLKLTWYKDETDLCKLDRLKSSTQGKFFSLSSNTSTHYFFRSRGDFVSNKSVRICQNKDKTKELLAQKNVPVPIGDIFNPNNEEEIINYCTEIGFPVVLKPLNGSMGKGVFTNISNQDELKEILENIKKLYNYKEYLVEKYYPGKEYRIYVVGDKVVGATNRVPANVVGDGIHTIKELIDQKNEDRKKNPYLAPKPIKIDFEVKQILKKAGYTTDTIPSKGEVVYLREKSNLSSGGDPIEATDELSEGVRQIAVDAFKALPDIPHGGVDIIVDPVSKDKGVVLEINATAEIGFHLFPLRGKAKDVPGAIIDYYFPETVGKPRSNFYFDYNSILEPLSKWATDQIVVSNPIIGQVYARKYIVSGKVQKVGYLTWIRRQALRKNIVGFAKKLENGSVEILAISNTEKVLDDLKELCFKGSKKSKVENVVDEVVTLSNQPIKIGFDLIL